MCFHASGFLLFELCVSIALTLLFSSLILFWHTRIVESQESMIERSRAAFLAASIRDELRAFNRNRPQLQCNIKKQYGELRGPVHAP